MADKRREPLRGRVSRGTEKTNSSGKKLCRYCMCVIRALCQQ